MIGGRVKYLVSLAFIAAGLIYLLFMMIPTQNESTQVSSSDAIRPARTPRNPVEMKKGRYEYFLKMLRDPATEQIPPNIRERELAFARTLLERSQTQSGDVITQDINWKSVGPFDVGGRTRALAVDIKDPKVIIAGGVSGGIWRSKNSGKIWSLRSKPNQVLSVTSLAQDSRQGHTKTWYYSSGEWDGNSASDRGFRARFYGSGLYKSTDGGQTWNLIQSANDPTRWDSNFDYITRVVVSPKTGSVFLAENSGLILRSTDGGQSFAGVFGGLNDHFQPDIVSASNGTLIASLSTTGFNSAPTNTPGVYKSTDDGQTWTNITPASFPASHDRSVIALAPSNPNICYIMTYTGATITGISVTGEKEDVRFHKIDVSTGASDDRTANLPDYGGKFGFIDTQSGYNMVVAVKPNDENHVFIGGTSLFRSRDGFSTKPKESDKNDVWIGGYDPANPDRAIQYANQHPDQHVIAFDPKNPNKMWVGHDGGVSLASNINAKVTASSSSAARLWTDMNNKYITTQFYTISIPNVANDDRIMGGTQDNGTPYFKGGAKKSVDISSGDGSYAYFGQNFAYVSSQNGRVFRVSYDNTGNPISPFASIASWSDITPKKAKDQLFVHPFAVDPSDENFMYYPVNRFIWRNNQLDNIPNFQNGTSAGWTKVNKFKAPKKYTVTALTVSRSNSPYVLYYAASGGFNSGLSPVIYRVENAHTAKKGAKKININNANLSNAYVHKIAVNPEDADEIMIVLSNYNIVGLYHSTNGGKSYTAVEGNLTGNASLPGPSLRAATILPSAQGTIYILATSTGVYSTRQLNGANTVWNQEAASLIGNTVVEDITSRETDGAVAVGTHGRGIYKGKLN